MRTFVTRGDGVDALRVVERPIPAPESRQVLVRMTAASLNYRDLLVINGVGSWKPPGERIPLSDGVGVVVDAAPDVTRFARGDRVAGIFLPHWLDGDLTDDTYVGPLGGAAADGVLTEYRVFAEDALVAVPTSLTDVQAASLPVAALTAWHAVVRRSQVQPGDTVLIQGTGGVSLFALQFTIARGAAAIVLSSSDDKLERARALGAVQTINYSRTPEWDDAVLALTGGRGVDHVIETVGGDNLNRSLRAVRVSGTISFIGLMAGLQAPINTYEFVTRNVRIHGIETGSRAMFEEMNRCIDQWRLTPIVDRVFGFSEVAGALRYLESGRHFGKLVIAMPAEHSD